MRLEDRRYVSPRVRLQPGKASRIIRPFNVVPGQKFVLALRKSGRERGCNLDDAEANLRRAVEAEGGVEPQACTCGYQRISHVDAEQMLLDKIAELNLQYDELTSVGIRDNIQTRLAQLWDADDETRQQWWEWLGQGVETLLKYMRKNFDVKGRELQRLEKAALMFYRWGGKIPRKSLEGLSVALADFKKAIKAVEQSEVERATKKVAALKQRHTELTLKWAVASGEQEIALKTACDELEVQLGEWRPRMQLLSERLEGICEAEASNKSERDLLFKEWPKLENREKGEALRRLFNKVTLYWERSFHPRSETPTRPLKTDRPGRYSYKVLANKTEWEFTNSGVGGPW